MKRKNTVYIIIGILFILFNVLAFAIPSSKTSVFWISYIFCVIAFFMQAFIWKISIESKTDLRSKFFRALIVNVGIVYFIIQIISFIFFMIFSSLPNWICIIVSMIILCLSLIGLITADSAIDTGLAEVERIDNKIAVKRQYIKEIQTEVEILAEKETNPDIKIKLTALAKKIHLSDPMSDNSLIKTEEEISKKINELKSENADKEKIINDIELLLFERNKKCKALKG